MKIPLSWIKDFVDIDLTLEDLCYQITMAGLEVEAVHFVGLPMPAGDKHEFKLSGISWEPDKIVVGAIHEVKPHPNADRLVLCELDDGEQIQTVLTGAPNLLEYKGKGPLEKPLKVCYAKEGATIINAYEPGFNTTVLKRKKIRGVDSYSMACSERELGISDEHEGIIILADDAPTGAPLVEYMGDAVLDIAITPNIARNANVWGIAREIAAITGNELRDPDTNFLAEGDPMEGRIAVNIPTPKINPRFVLGLIENVEVKPSPYEIQRRLRLAGMRPISNIVDATNYVMLEIGEPLHAFDYDVLLDRAKKAGAEHPTLHTRLAEKGEKLVTLDNIERTLDDFTVLVCDQSGSLALAGVMGGLESEVSNETTSVLLEGAAWNIINTRRTVMSQKLSSEAAYRFSRGVHPAMAPRGVSRGLEMMRRWGNGLISQGLVDNYPLPPIDATVSITPHDTKRWLGLDLKVDEISDILSRLGFKIEIEEDTLHVTSPDHRMDIGTGVIGQADLMEEISRIYGYQNIPETRLADSLPPQRGNRSLEIEEHIRDLLIDQGLQEIITYRVTNPDREARRLAPGSAPDDKPYTTLINPMVSDRFAMRHSLLASVLDIVETNANIRDRIALFEIGPIFIAGEAELPDELDRLVIAATGPRHEAGWQSADTTPMDFFDMKGFVQGMLNGLHVENITYEPTTHPSFHPGKCALISSNSQRIGLIGELHPKVIEQYNFPENAVLAAEFYLETLLDSVPDRYESSPVPTHPPIIEDVAFIVSESLPAAKVAQLIEQTGRPWITDVNLFDVYRGDQIGPGSKSLAYRLTYQAPDRTLNDKEVAKTRRKIAARLERETGAKLRES